VLTTVSRTKWRVTRLRTSVQRTRRIPASGRGFFHGRGVGLIGLPEIEVVELSNGREPRVSKLEPRRRGLLGRVVDHSRFLLEPNSFVLLEIVDDLPTERGQPRCVLQVRPGMEGEVTIGVARMTVAQILGDPELRAADGRARLPLPNGARVRIAAQGFTFLARVGGPPLLRPTPAPGPLPDGTWVPAF
jgi:hypothetical protein